MTKNIQPPGVTAVKVSRRGSDTRSAINPPAVVLVRPREEGNVGAVARAMANMGLSRLILVEPAPPLGGVARGFGIGGWKLLDDSSRADSLEEAVAAFGRVVGTSSARQRPLRRTRVIAPRELPGLLREDPPGTATALVFGPEDNGLSREELERCSPVVTIPCAHEHPTLNLAQAVLIIAYELYAADLGEPRDRNEEPPLATAAEIDALLAAASRVLYRVGFDHDHIHAGLLRDLRRLAGRSGIIGIETRILRRVSNRILRRLGEPETNGDPE